MRRTRWLHALAAATLTVLLLVGTGWGRTIKGVEIPETLRVDDTRVSLVGAGVRKKFFFSVYVAALYQHTPSPDAGEAIHRDEPKALTMHFLRDVGEDRIRQSFRDGFFNNAQERLPQLQERIDRLLRLFEGGVEEGTAVRAAYLPGRGTRVRIGDRQILLEGIDFMEALWSIWLGDVPADYGLKQELLGRS